MTTDFPSGSALPPAFVSSPMDALGAFSRARNRLRILAVVAEPPTEGRPLDLRREWVELVKRAREGALPAALFRLLPPTRESLQRALRACMRKGVPPHVLHFAGHGDVLGLVMEDELGRKVISSREDLAADLRDMGVKLVVLNGCHTARQETRSLADELVKKGIVQAAIGHERPVPDGAAIVFATHLYRGLCEGKTLLEAFTAAEGQVAKVFPAAAQATRLLGSHDLSFGHLEGSTGGEGLVFDGSSGRGSIPDVAHFFGRTDDVVELGEVLSDPSRRAIAIAGIGGMGKTALAKELARRHVWRFPGGVAFTSVRTAALFGEATAVSLVRSANTALSLFGGGDPLQSLVEHLGRQPALVIFDNLEDLPEKELERLLYVIEQFPLGGPKAILTLRPSPELLRERPWLGSRTLTSGLSKHAGAAYVLYAAEMQRLRGFDEALAAEVVSRVSGHPKMIEIAVGMAATRGIEAMRAELGKGEGKALEERLEGLLSSSIGLLDEDGRWVLSLSGVFPGDTFSREEMVAAGDAALLQEGDELSARVEEARPRVERGIRACVAAGLVAWDEGRGVFGVHAAVQGFARGRMGLGEEVGARVVMGLVMQAYRYVGEHRGDFAALERRLGFLLAMFEVGWDWGEQFAKLRKMVVAAVDVMGSFFLRCGYWPVMERWRERLAAVVPEDRAALAARLYREAELLENHGKLEEAKAKALDVLRIQEERKDRRGVAASLHQLAIIESQQGRDDEARRLLQESIAVEEEIGNRAGLASSLVMLGQLEVQRGNLAEGRQLVQKSVDILEEIGGGELPTAREILASIDAMQTPP